MPERHWPGQDFTPCPWLQVLSCKWRTSNLSCTPPPWLIPDSILPCCPMSCVVVFFWNIQLLLPLFWCAPVQLKQDKKWKSKLLEHTSLLWSLGGFWIALDVVQPLWSECAQSCTHYHLHVYLGGHFLIQGSILAVLTAFTLFPSWACF